MTAHHRTDQGTSAANARIELLLGELGACTDPHVAARTRELVQLLADLYGAGLGRVVALTQEHSRTGDLLEALGDDPLVGPLLLLHDLHPLPLEARVVRCVGRVGTLAALRGVTVTLDSQDEACVRLGIGAVSPACAGALADVAQALERAIAAAAPEIERIEIARVEGKPDPALIQITRAPAATETAADPR